MTLSALEFVRRFLLHVLPSGFVRIRRYGILSNRHRGEKMALCRRLLALDVATGSELLKTTEPSENASLITPTSVCPICGAGRMIVMEELPPPPARLEIGSGSRSYVLLDSS
jgi:hypothetical protein